MYYRSLQPACFENMRPAAAWITYSLNSFTSYIFGVSGYIMVAMIIKNFQNKQVSDVRKQVQDYLRYAYTEASCAGFMFCMMYLSASANYFSKSYEGFLQTGLTAKRNFWCINGSFAC